MAAGSGSRDALQIPLFKEEIKEGEEVRQVGKEKWLAKPPNVCNPHKGEVERRRIRTHQRLRGTRNHFAAEHCVSITAALREEKVVLFAPQCDKSTHAVVGRNGHELSSLL